MLSLGLAPGQLSVLCLGAHPDDIEIGCGGTLLHLAARPATTVSAVVMTGAPERCAESRAALAALSPGVATHFGDLPDGRLPSVWGAVKEELECLATTRGRVDLVLAPRVDDAHQDHRLLGRLAPTVWRDALVLHYEIPKWDGDLGQPSHYLALSDEQAHWKVDLLNEHFPSQRSRDWWDDEMFLGLMRIRGMECRTRYAEAFFAGKVRVDLGSAEGVRDD